MLKILRASISKRQYRNTVVIRTEYLLNLQQRFCYSIVTRKCFLFLKRKATFIFWLILFNCFCLYSPIGSRSMSFSIPFLTGFFFYFFFFPDIDECLEGTAKCNQYCHNSDGGYVCSCHQGYTLDSDKHTCVGKETHLLLNFVLTVLLLGPIGWRNTCPRYTDAKIPWQ